MAMAEAHKPGTRKVTVSALGGAIVVIATYVLGMTPLPPLPPEVVAAATTVVTALITYMTSETYS